MGRSIGLDVHRDFCQVAIADGGRARSAGRIATTPEQLALFAQSLGPTDRVVLEATGNALAIARILEPHVAEVVLAHAKQVRAISHARIKTDKVDAKVLADLLAADLIPAVWIGDERVRMLRRLVSRRRGLVKRRTQIKNEICAVLHRNLKGRNPASDPFGKKGRAWIAAQQLPLDERLTVDAGLRQLDFLGDVAGPDRRDHRSAGARRRGRAAADDDPRRRRRDRRHAGRRDRRRPRFPSARHLVATSAASDDPPVGQRAGPARPHIEEGPAAARHVLVEAAWSAAKSPDRCAPSSAHAAVAPARRYRRGRAQARRPCLHLLTRARLRLRAPEPRAPQDPRPRARAGAPRAKPGPSPTPSGTPHTPPSCGSPSRPRSPTAASSATGRPAPKRVRRYTGARISKALEGQGRAAGHKLLTPALRHFSHPHPHRSVPQAHREFTFILSRGWSSSLCSSVSARRFRPR